MTSPGTVTLWRLGDPSGILLTQPTNTGFYPQLPRSTGDLKSRNVLTRSTVLVTNLPVDDAARGLTDEIGKRPSSGVNLASAVVSLINGCLAVKHERMVAIGRLAWIQIACTHPFSLGAFRSEVMGFEIGRSRLDGS